MPKRLISMGIKRFLRGKSQTIYFSNGLSARQQARQSTVVTGKRLTICFREKFRNLRLRSTFNIRVATAKEFNPLLAIEAIGESLAGRGVDIILYLEDRETGIVPVFDGFTNRQRCERAVEACSSIRTTGQRSVINLEKTDFLFGQVKSEEPLVVSHLSDRKSTRLNS